MKLIKPIPAILACITVTAHAVDKTGASAAGDALQTIMALAVVLGLIVACAWLLKRFGITKRVAGTTIKIVGGVNVGNRERIIIVEIADQWLVVGVAPGRVNTLTTMPRQESNKDNPAVQEVAPVGKAFSAWLRQTVEKRNGKE